MSLKQLGVLKNILSGPEEWRGGNVATDATIKGLKEGRLSGKKSEPTRQMPYEQHVSVGA